MTNDQDLQALRARIDALDEQLQTLISERARCAQQVAEVKRAAGELNDFYRPEREAEVLRRVAERNKGPLTNEALVQIYRELMSACRGLEGPLHVAFLVLKAHLPKRRRTNISAIPSRPCHWRRLMKCSAKWRRAPRITASSLWRIPPKA